MRVSTGVGRCIVVFGKGGIGKTTVATNLGEALTDMGRKVMIIGCSPKSSLIDVYGLRDEMMPVLELKRRHGVSSGTTTIKSIHETADGLTLAETGGPEPAVGCAGSGLPLALDEIERQMKSLGIYGTIDCTIYDVIGDVVCGGFSTPLRGGEERCIGSNQW